MIDLETEEAGLIFKDNGEVISAGSVGIITGGELYIGQIMDPFIISLPLD